MNWEAIGAIGEILGAVAVLVTLLYLALQIKQNTAALKQAGREHNYDASARLSEQIAYNKDLARIWRLGRSSLEALDQDDRLRWRVMVNTRIVYWQIVYMRSTELGDAFMVDVSLDAVCELLEHRMCREHWDASAHQYRPEFVKQVRRRLARHARTGSRLAPAPSAAVQPASGTHNGTAA